MFDNNNNNNNNKNKKSLFTTVGGFITWVKIAVIAIAMVALVASCGEDSTSTYSPPNNPPGSTLIKNLGIDAVAANSFTVGLDTIDPVEYPDAAYRLIVMSNNGDFATGRYSATPTITGGRVQLSVTDAATIGDGQVYQATVKVVSRANTNTVYETSAPFAVITGVATAAPAPLVAAGVTNDGQTLKFVLTPGAYQAFYAVAGPDANNLLGEIPGNINRYFALPNAPSLLKDGVDSDVKVISNSGTATYTVEFTGIIIGFEYKVVVKPVVPRYIINAKMVDGNGAKQTFGAAIKEAIKSGANLASTDIDADATTANQHATYTTRNTDGSVGDIALLQSDLKVSSTNVYFSFNHAVGATHYRYIITNTTVSPNVQVSDDTITRAGAYAGYKSGALDPSTNYLLTVIASNEAGGQTKRKQLTFTTSAAGNNLAVFTPLVLKNENVDPVTPGVIKLSFAKQDNAGITAYNIYYKPHDANPNNFPTFPQKIITIGENPTNEFVVPGSVLGLPYDVRVEAVSGSTVLGATMVLTDAFKSYTAPEIRNISFSPNPTSVIIKDYGSSLADGLKLYTRGRGITWDGTMANTANGIHAYINYNRPGTTTMISNGDATPSYLINADNSDLAVELAAMQAAVGKSFNVTVVITNVNSGLVTRSTRTFTHGSLIYPPLNTDITVTPGDKQLDISWRNVDSKGSSIAIYNVSVTNLGGPGTNVIVPATGNSGQVTVTGLMNTTNYSVFILPIDTHGLNVVEAGFMTSPILDFQNSPTDGQKLGRYISAGVPVDPSSTAPGPVTGLTLAAGSDPTTSIEVSWTAPASPGTTDGTILATLTGYRVVYSTAGGATMEMPVAANTTTATITGLQRGVAYTVVVYADNSAGRSSQATKTINTAASQATAPGQPGTVTFPAANVKGTSMNVSWPASTFGKNHAGTDYTDADVTYNVAVTTNGVADAGAVVGNVMGTTTKTVTITGLTRNTLYTVTVTPSNPDGGPGTASVGTQRTATTLATAPTRPPSVTISGASQTGFVVDWAASVTPGLKADGITAYNNAEVIYTVTISPNTGITMASNNQLRRTFTTLTPGTLYTVTVTPSNPDGGQGISRDATQGTLSAATPPTAAPTSPVFSAVTGSGFTLRWTHITSGFGMSHTGTAYTDHDITYDVAITSGGSAVSGAVIGGVTSPSSTLRESVISGLSPYVTYTVTVTSRNADGGAGGSGAVLTTTQRTASAATPPGQPGVVSFGTTTGNSMVVDWLAGTSLGTKHDGTAYNSADIAYTVVISPSNTSVSMVSNNQLRRTFTGLSPSTSYTVTVTPSTPDGGVGATSSTGTKSTTSSAATAPSQPGTVTIGTVTETGFVVNWVASANPGLKADGTTAYNNADVIYTVTISPNVGTMVSNSQLQRTFTGLSPFTSYTVTVTPRTPDGGAGLAQTGIQSTLSAATAPTGRPTFPALSAVTGTGFTLQWTHITSGFGERHDGTAYADTDITYDVAVSLSGVGVSATIVQSTVNPTTRRAVISGLVAGNIYTITVTPRNPDGGDGLTAALTTSQLTSAATPPGQPGAVTFGAVTVNSIVVNWVAGTFGNKHDGSGYAAGDVTYNVVISPSNTGVTRTGTGLTRTFSGLTTNTVYTVTVTPSNPDGGDGTATVPANTRTADMVWIVPAGTGAITRQSTVTTSAGTVAVDYHDVWSNVLNSLNSAAAPSPVIEQANKNATAAGFTSAAHFKKDDAAFDGVLFSLSFATPVTIADYFMQPRTDYAGGPSRMNDMRIVFYSDPGGTTEISRVGVAGTGGSGSPNYGRWLNVNVANVRHVRFVIGKHANTGATVSGAVENHEQFIHINLSVR